MLLALRVTELPRSIEDAELERLTLSSPAGVSGRSIRLPSTKSFFSVAAISRPGLFAHGSCEPEPSLKITLTVPLNLSGSSYVQ